MARRPGEVGRYCFSPIALPSLSPAGDCPAGQTGQLSLRASNGHRFGARSASTEVFCSPCRSYAPSYISSFSPSFKVTIAFFQSGRFPANRPKRFIFPGTFMT